MLHFCEKVPQWWAGTIKPTTSGAFKETTKFCRTDSNPGYHRVIISLNYWFIFSYVSQSQRGSRSKHAEQEVSSSWAGAEDLKKVEEELEASMDPSSGSSRWKPSSSSSSSQAQGQYEEAGQKAAALAQMSQTGSLRRGMTAQVGITPPRTKSTSASLKTPGRRFNTLSSSLTKFCE